MKKEFNFIRQQLEGLEQRNKDRELKRRDILMRSLERQKTSPDIRFSRWVRAIPNRKKAINREFEEYKKGSVPERRKT